MSDWLARAVRHRSFMIGGILTFVLLALAFVSLFWTPNNPYRLNIRMRLKPPSLDYLLGTDAFGRDVVSQLMVGAQNSIVVGVIAVAIGLSLGVSLGLIGAARRGWLEELIMRFSDFTLAFPAVLSAILLTAIFGPGSLNSIVAIGIYNIPVFARLSRAAGNSIWARDFVTASRACGKGAFRITIEHVLPNIVPIIVVQATIQFAIAILAEAALSYLGLGTQPPTPSWGRMLNEAQTHVFTTPSLAIYPGLAIAFSVLGLNLLGDGLRDLIDPKLARQR
ncbi:MAG: ABC transporter permease [Alphaproteobacteria bacterium]|jgi:peptide/nickel transport system permease protein|nr:ABC transporter permease [Alphaproteobacteria bacterium]